MRLGTLIALGLAGCEARGPPTPGEYSQVDGSRQLAATGSARLPVWVYIERYHDMAGQVINAVNAGATGVVIGWWLYKQAQGYYLQDALYQYIYDDPNHSEQPLIDAIKRVRAAAPNVKMLITTGGDAGDLDWLSAPPAEYAEKFCGDAKRWGMDGVDFDLEHLSAGYGSNSQFGDWIKTAIAKCREVYPGVFISGAPQSPYVEPDWCVGECWSDYDFDSHLIQYYNQYRAAEQTKDGLFYHDQGASIAELSKRTLKENQSKFVVGKQLTGDGVVDWNDLHTWGCEYAIETGWRGGFMIWRWYEAETESAAQNQQSLDALHALSQPCPGMSDDENGGDKDEPTTTPKPQPDPETTPEGCPTWTTKPNNNDGCPTWTTKPDCPTRSTWPEGCPTWKD